MIGPPSGAGFSRYRNNVRSYWVRRQSAVDTRGMQTTTYSYSTYPIYLKELQRKFRLGHYTYSQYPELLATLKQKCEEGQKQLG